MEAASILQISELVPEPFLPESEAALSPKSDKTQQHIKTPQSEELEWEAESDRVNGKLGLGGRRAEWRGGEQARNKENIRHPKREEVDTIAPEGLEHVFGHVGFVDATVLVAFQSLHAMLPYVPHLQLRFTHSSQPLFSLPSSSLSPSVPLSVSVLFSG
jgi:hypothetical protein